TPDPIDENGISGQSHPSTIHIDDDVADSDSEGESGGKELDDAYGSASGRGAFGADPDEPGSNGSRNGNDSVNRGVPAGGKRSGLGSQRGRGVRHPGSAELEREVRRSRMLSYVARSGAREGDGSKVSSSSDDLSDL